MHLLIKVAEIQGNCPVYKLGDQFKLEDGYKLVSDIPVCMHALSALMPHYNALRISEPDRWGLDGMRDKSKAYIQCPDAVKYTGGGAVVFEISRMD